MYRTILLIFLFFTTFSLHAKEDENVDQAIEFLKVACVTGGEKVEINASGDAGITLKSWRKAGVKAQASIKKEEVQGLINDINELSVGNASSVRECMKPYIDKILVIILGVDTGKVKKEEISSPKKRDLGIAKIAISNYFPPMYDNRRAIKEGFEIDLIKEVAKIIGYTDIQFIQGSGGPITPVIKGNAVFGIGAVSITSERKKRMAFSSPYFRTYQVILKNVNSLINKRDDIYSKKCVVRKNSLSEKIARQYRLSCKKVKSKDEVLEHLSKGDADFTIIDLAYASYMSENDSQIAVVDIPFKVNINDEAFYDYYGIVLNKNNSLMKQEVDDALSQLENNGMLQKLKNKWMKLP